VSGGQRRKQIGVKRSVDPLDGLHRVVDCLPTRRAFEKVRRQTDFDIRIEKVKRGAQRSHLNVRRKQLAQGEGISLHLQLVVASDPLRLLSSVAAAG
jgi:hypothetical protein